MPSDVRDWSISRGAWYNRHPTPKATCTGSTLNLGSTGDTLLAFYTVPTGRALMLSNVVLHINRTVAPVTLGDQQMSLAGIGGFVNNALSSIDATVNKLRRLGMATATLVPAGASLRVDYKDTSSVDTRCDAYYSADAIEFDA